MADKLSIYNLALGYLEEDRLASLTENRQPRRVLDDYWPRATGWCLERKPWNFLYRTVEMQASASIDPSFGFLYAFQIPDDWVRTHKISAVPTLDPPLLQMAEEAGYWFTNITPIFVRYNSNDPAVGMDTSRWPESFVDFVALRLARVACKRISGKTELLVGPQGLIKQEERAGRVAASLCAMNDPVGFQPMTSWVRARRGFMPMMPSPGGDAPTGGSLVP